MTMQENTMKPTLRHPSWGLVGTLIFTSLILSLGAGIPARAAEKDGETKTTQNENNLPQRKHTVLGLYVTAREAYDMWKAAPDKVKIIDVRTPEEYAFIGHPERAWNVPFAFVTYQRKNGKTEHGAKMNADFVAEVKSIAGPNDKLLLMCRSGDRSARACDQLAAGGFKQAYTITDGMEGDKVEDPENLYTGKRMKNGWKNTGLPWIYSIDPDKILIAESSGK